MGYQPWYAHDTYPAIQIPLNVEGVADNITGLTAANLKMIIRNLSAATDQTGTGTFTIVTSNPAVVNYQFSDADTTFGQNCALFIAATFPGAGGGVAYYDPIPFTFTAD